MIERMDKKSKNIHDNKEWKKKCKDNRMDDIFIFSKGYVWQNKKWVILSLLYLTGI